jgi:RND family efflux transporter MFP subunit
MKRWILFGLCAPSFVLLGLGCGTAKPRKGGFVERLPQLEVVHPARKRIQRRVELAATVEALQRVDLSARVPGVVSYLPAHIDIGREVKKDEVLLRLAVPELDADEKHKEALLHQAEKQHDQAMEAHTVTQREVEESRKEEKRYLADLAFYKSRLVRIARLVKERAQDPLTEQEAQRQVDAAAAALDANRARTKKLEAKVTASDADVAVAQARIKTAKAEVAKLTETIKFATVLAPFDGVITRRWVDPGAIIKDPGATLLTVMQIHRVRVLVDVPQRDVPYLNAREQNPNPDGRGDPVEVRLPALAEVFKETNGVIFGYITRMSRSLDPVTRTMRAEIELENPKGHLQPGMYGTASILVVDRSNRLTVPAAALVRRGEGKVEVYVVEGAQGEGDERVGVLKAIAVKLGIDDGKEVEIQGGLKGRELVVARSTGVMRLGDRVIAVSERD